MLLPVTVVLPLGMVALAPMHIWLLEVAMLHMLCLYFLWLNLEKLFGLTYIHLYPQHIVGTYGYSQTYHIWKISEEVGHDHVRIKILLMQRFLNYWFSIEFLRVDI